jgi:pimeloyl-ACP methyl ester carboxylesterase
MILKRWWVFIIILSCANLTPIFAQAVPRFEPVDCPSDARLPVAFHCGYLIVRADRSQPDSPTLRLMVAIYASPRSDKQPDPIIFLNGGPGSATVIGAARTNQAFSNLSERDIIYFDQRGTGYSEPDMTCPEIDAADYANLAQAGSLEDHAARLLEAARTCHDRLIAAGVNPALYNSAASAADVADLRLALGYDEVNLLGLSYGTRLALTVMRDHPEGIRTVTLDSVYPPNVDLITPFSPNVQSIFDRIFAACATDTKCNSKYPDLPDVFSAVIDQMNTTPVTVMVNKRPFVIDGYSLVIAMFY